MEFLITSYLIPALIIFGASLILSQSILFDPLRRFLASNYSKNFFSKWGWLLITCQVCTSFWLGMILGLIFPAYSFTQIFILDGILGSAFTVFLGLIMKKLDQVPQPPQTGCSGCGKGKKQEE